MSVLVLTNICFQIDNIPTNKYFRIHANTNLNTSIKKFLILTRIMLLKMNTNTLTNTYTHSNVNTVFLRILLLIVILPEI